MVETEKKAQNSRSKDMAASFSNMMRAEFSKFLKKKEASNPITINFDEVLVGTTSYYNSRKSKSLILDSWIIDSGATCHTCSNPNLMTNVRKSKDHTPVSQPDETIRQIEYIGEI